MSKEIPSLHSKRLTIKGISENDASFIYFMRSDPIVNEFIDRKKTTSIDDALKFIKERRSDNQQGRGYFWSIYARETERIIGSICLWKLNRESKVAELGYDLDPKFQKQGFMGEAVELILQFGFQELGLHQIHAITSRQNKASQKVLSRAAFLHTDTILSEEDRAKNLLGYKLARQVS